MTTEYLNISSSGVTAAHFFVNGAGLVGIGTAVPNQRLVVQNIGAGIVANFTTITGQGNITLKDPAGKEWNCGVSTLGVWGCA